ncbi:MAG: DUF4339 domain-containing protein [Phycisphaerae bacterium]|nr:DUF4339 domain-containing protein [Saprospiraceae bacterium]
MKKYYLHNGSQQTGPFSIEDLKQKSLNPEDMVWFEGQKEWQEASTIEELSSVFNRATPPPFVKKEASTPPPIKLRDNEGEPSPPKNLPKDLQPQLVQQKKKSGGTRLFLILIATFIIGLIVYAHSKGGGSGGSSFNYL